MTIDKAADMLDRELSADKQDNEQSVEKCIKQAHPVARWERNGTLRSAYKKKLLVKILIVVSERF